MNQPQTIHISEPTEIDELAFKLSQAKLAEQEARERRVFLEMELLKLLPEKEEGTATEKGHFFKASVTTGFTRKITDIEAMKADVPEDVFQKLVRQKYELNTSYLKSLAEAASDVYLKAARHIEAKPKKPAVKIDELI